MLISDRLGSAQQHYNSLSDGLSDSAKEFGKLANQQSDQSGRDLMRNLAKPIEEAALNFKTDSNHENSLGTVLRDIQKTPDSVLDEEKKSKLLKAASNLIKSHKAFIRDVTDTLAA